jgi:UV excision repair protein RAD23
MIINVKTLKGVDHKLELHGSDATVGQVKTLLDENYNCGAAATQKIIFRGKILSDDVKVAELGLLPAEFVVVMNSNKPRAAPAPVPVPTVTAHVPAPAPVAVVHTPVTAAAPATDLGAASDENIAKLMDFGFNSMLASAALNAAYNNLDRAADYLFSGKSLKELQDMSSAASLRPPTMAPAPPTMTPGAPSAGAQTAQAMSLLQQNPETLDFAIQMAAQANPEIKLQYDADPAGFKNTILQALNNMTPEMLNEFLANGGMPGMPGSDHDSDGGGYPPE